jgi:hypothetical protein
MKVTSRKGAVLQEHVELEHTASWYTLVFLLGVGHPPFYGLHKKDILRKFCNTDHNKYNKDSDDSARFASNYAFLFAESLTKTLETLGNLLQSL